MTGGPLSTDTLPMVHAVLMIVGALLPVVNPPGDVPLFLTLTRGCDEVTRRDLAKSIALYSFGLLLGSLLFGSFVLRVFGLSVAVMEVAGGAVVCALGWQLLHAESAPADAPADPHRAREVAEARAFYPLTLPVTVDAGVIAVAITLGAHHGPSLKGDLIQVGAAIIGAGTVALTVLLAYRYADRVSVWLGHKGMEVFLRLSALIVLSIGVQIVWNGVKSLLAEIGIGTT